jgi:hypothetical protein
MHTVTASVDGREKMAHLALLGRDIPEHYHVDVTRRTGRAPDAKE